MAVSSTEIVQAAEEARLAILKAITEAAPNCQVHRLAGLAEAYAWVMYPNQSHGGSVSVTS